MAHNNLEDFKFPLVNFEVHQEGKSRDYLALSPCFLTMFVFSGGLFSEIHMQFISTYLDFVMLRTQ